MKPCGSSARNSSVSICMAKGDLMSENKLNGRRYVCLVRCSTDQQTDTSIPDQIRLLHAFAQQRGMIHAGDDMILDGVSGSRPGARSDIEKIVLRKQRRNDFDVLLVQDTSRLTRGGVEHGAKVEFDLSAAGIELLFANGNVIEGDHAGIVKSVEYYSAQQYAKNVSFAVARGQMSAILDGRMAHCLRPPYAVDRLYLSLDNRPVHVLRSRSDGSQQKLDPTTGAILETYPRHKKGEPDQRYRKQESERVVLIPGAPEAIAAVRQMFRRRLVDGWGNWRIAKELNDQGLPSPNGKPWCMQTVKMLLRNTVYTGKGVANKRTHSIYHSRSANAPTKSDVSRRDWATRKQPKTRYRPRAEWIEQPLPALADFLGDELRDLAIVFHSQFLNEVQLASPVKADKHVDSKFILKGILRSKQGNFPRTGKTQGTKEKPYRYYHASSACRIPSSDRLLRKTVPAEPLEVAILQTVAAHLVDVEFLRPQIETALREQSRAVLSDGENLTELQDQRKGLAEQLVFVIEELSSIGKDAAKRKIRQLESQISEIDRRVAKASKSAKDEVQDIPAATEQILRGLVDLGTRLRSLPPHTLRSILSILIVRLEVDLETKFVELDLALPNWAVFEPNTVEAQMGLDEKFLQRSSLKAQCASLLLLAELECKAIDPKCVQCRRRAA